MFNIICDDFSFKIDRTLYPNSNCMHLKYQTALVSLVELNILWA